MGAENKSPEMAAEKVDILFLHVDSFYNMTYSMFSIGTLYVATVCQENGYKVKCLSTVEIFNMGDDELRRSMEEWQPKMVGFYSVIDNIHTVRHFAGRMKQWFPKLVTVVGGPMASTVPKELALNSCFNFVVPGEGEYVMLALANCVIRGEGKLEDVPSIVYRKGKEIAANPRAAVIEDLDSLPFPDLDLVHMTYGLHMSTGRGCPYQCAFCFKEDYNTRFRCRSAQNIADEIIARMERYNVTNVYITDDVFAMDHKRVEEFCRIIIDYKRRSKKDFVFFCEGRAEVIAKHPEMLEALVEAGMVRLQIGIESGDAQMLRDYGKKLSPEHVFDTVMLAQKLQKLTVVGNFIIGGPHESEITLSKSVEFAKLLLRMAPAIFECSNSPLSALPGTRITQHPEEYGIKVVDKEFLKGMTLSDAYCETEHLNRHDIRHWCRFFDSEMHKTMQEIIVKADYDTLKRHYDWAYKWRLQTFYYANFLASNGLLQNYFNLLQSPRCRRLKDIPMKDIAQYVPMRSVAKCTYSRDGKQIFLPGVFGKSIVLHNPLGMLLYEYASSKLNIAETAIRLKQELRLPQTLPMIITKVMLPVYRKLEACYQLVFCK